MCENPSIYLQEVQKVLLETTGTDASAATICRTLKRLGFTRKRMKYVALQRCDTLRAEYQAEVSTYDSSMLVFNDESGCDQKDAMRRFGYSLRGYPSKSTKLMSKGKQFSAIGVMTTTALLDAYVVEGTVDGDVSINLCNHLSQLMPFNGTNHNSVVIPQQLFHPPFARYSRSHP